MEIGAEISQKIRAAIKAKLVDLGAYVDDELPDYIMVMVANKKTQSQMTEDLNLFLGNNTEAFTVWLSSLLNKLQSIASDSTEKLVDQQHKVVDGVQSEIGSVTDSGAAKEDGKSKKEEKVKLIQPKEESVIEPDIEINVEKDEFAEEAQETKTDVQKVTETKQIKISPPKSKERNVQKKNLPVIVKRSPSDSSVADPPRAIVKAVPSPARRTHKRNTVSSSSHRRSSAPESVVGSVVKHDVEDEEEEYDPYHPAIGSVASVIRVTERKSSIPPKLQANKSLLLRAVKDAHVSTAKNTKKQIVEPTVVRPISQRAGSRKHVSSSGRHLVTSTPKADRELFSKSRREEIMQRFKDELASEPEEERNVYIVKDERKVSHLQHEQVDSSLVDADSGTTINESEILTLMESGAEDSDFGDLPEDHKIITQQKKQDPKFVVTLEGVDPEDYEDVSEIDVEEINKHTKKRGTSTRPLLTLDFDEDEQMESPPKMQKLEKCRFWPHCKNGDQCPFHHPSVECKSFPHCHYKEKCLYIHPACKFDARCTKPECPFTHTYRRPTHPAPVPQPTLVIQPIKVPVFTPNIDYQKPSHPSQVKCRFFPKCTNMECPFLHPRPCRFGISCNNKETCQFSHPDLPGKDRLKWSRIELDK